MKYTIIDVREPNEFAESHVNGAVNIPLGDIANGTEQLRDIPKDAAVIVYCRSGGRSNMAKGILTNMGYTNVVNGINEAEVSKNFNLQ